jgi:hypothetical protein
MGRYRRAVAVIGASLAVLVLTSAGLLVGPADAVPLGSSAPLGTVIDINGSVGPGLAPNVISPEFWGANVRPNYVLGTGASSTYRSAGLSVVRWPGGATADRLNVTANRIYNDNGTYSTPPSNESDFVTWCRSVGCSAVIGLPGEINSPSTAAYYVQYTEKVLHFTPMDWEIGNEPFQWTHFGSPWSAWSAAQSANATPASYAEVVHSYIAAIRAVDPSAHVLGLPGVGQGAYGEAGWIRATVAVNGPNLSGVAIHVYPAGGTVSGAATLSGFFATLNGTSSLSNRLSGDRAAVAAACPSCRSVPVLVTELGSGTQGGGYNAYMTSFPDVPYLASEAVQAFVGNVTQIDIYAFQATYGGSLLLANGTASLTGLLYEQLLSRVGPVLSSTLPAPAGSGLSGIVTRTAAASSTSVFVSNTNLTRAFTVVLRGTTSSNAFTSTLVTWNNSTSTPVHASFFGTSIPVLRVPPDSVGLLIVNSSVRGVHVTGPSASTPFPGSGTEGAAAALGLVAAVPAIARRGLGRGAGA